MTYNLLGYLLYLPASFYITVVVGRSLYRAGNDYLEDCFAGQSTLAHTCNRILLLGYYLVNLGYATYSVSFWNHVSNPVGLAEELSLRLGLLISGLACLHYFNLYAILKFRNAIQILLKQYL